MTSSAVNNNNIDLQSWWEVPSIAHFCSLFRVAFNLLDFDIEELEEALLTDGTELNGSSLLQELIVRLLAGCLGHNGISTFNYQMFLRRLFRSKCKEQGRDNPFNTDIDFQFLPLRTKVEILHALCDFRLDADDVIDVLKNLDSDSLRVHPLGYDDNKSAYWYFYGTRLYREDYPKKKRKKKESNDKGKSKKKKKERGSSNDEEEDDDDKERNKSDEEGGNDSDISDEDWGTLGLGTWQVMCYTEDDWQNLADSMVGSSCKEERALFQVLSEDFLPEIPRLFEEKERLQRKRMMENQPRRQSQRLEKLKSQKDVAQVSSDKEKDKAVPSPTSPKQKKDASTAGRRKRGRGRSSAKRNNSASRSPSSLRSSSSDSERSLIPSGGRRRNNSVSSMPGGASMKSNNYAPGGQDKYQSTPLWRRTREDLMTGLYKILDRVKAHKDAWPFLDPVDETYAPRYYAVIARPMDLQKMEDKLDNGEYGSLQQFRADFQLIVDNCRQYNGSGNEYTEMVLRLRALFDACAERFLEADEASSDSDAPPLLHRPLSDGFDDDDDVDSLQSSFTPVNGPNSLSDRSRTRSLTSLSEGSVIMSEDEIDDDHDSDNTYDPRRPKEAPRRGTGTGMRGRPPRSPVAHASRARHRRKRRRRKRKGSVVMGGGAGRRSGGRGISTSSSRSNSRKPGPKPKSLQPPPPSSRPVEEPTAAPGDQPAPVPNKPKRGRPANSGKNQLKLLQQQQQQQQQQNPPPPRKSPSPESFDRERQRRRVNYKEEDTTDSDDLLSSASSSSSTSGSMSSFINHKPHGRGRPPAHAQVMGPKKPVKKAGVIKNMEAIEQLELATEQTLKDINRWLDETPRFSDFSSNSNSPLHVPTYVVEEMATIEGEYKKRIQQVQNNRPRDRFSNDLHRRRIYKEQIGLKRKREIQRTIDRLQPGKSKGNLLSKDRNSAAAGTNPSNGPTTGAGDDSAANSETKPLVLGAISLGKVLETDMLGLGGGDSASSAQPIKSSDDDATGDKLVIEEESASGEVSEEKKKNGNVEDIDAAASESGEVKEEVKKEEVKKEKPTPNLSAWFKAFGAPKAQNTAKKKPEPEVVKEKPAPVLASVENAKEDDLGPNSPGMPARRQRKTSTGSSVSERSSFSQEPGDVQSPRSEPYLSPQSNPQTTPLHHPQHHYPPTGGASPINGAIKVGFYQDTGACVSPAASPYGHSPVGAGNPQPPYGYHYPEHDHMSRREYGGPPMSPRPASRTPTPLDEYHSPPPRAQSGSSGYPTPTSPRSPVHPSLYAHGGGVPSYPSHLSYYEQAAAASAYREKPPPVYPVKKRYNTAAVAAAASNNMNNNPGGGFTDVDNKGGSFTPTREAMEHERTFTPTPGRMPIAHHHPLLMDHRHLMEQYYPGGGGPPGTPQPSSQPPSAPSSPVPVVSGASPSHVPLNFATARSPPTPRSPLNYSQTEAPHQEHHTGGPPMHHPEDASNAAALAAAAAYRLNDMLPGKPPFHHPINYPSPNEEFSKLYANTELHQRLNYSHQMADLSQQMARYSFHELMAGKGPPPVYNHPPPGSYGNIIPPPSSTYPRPLSEMMQANKPASKLEPVTSAPPQPPAKPKRGRKKKNEVPPPSPVIQPSEPPPPSFQQWHSSGGYLDQQPPPLQPHGGPNNRVESHAHAPSPTVNCSNSAAPPGGSTPSYFTSSGPSPGRPPPTGPSGYPPPPAAHHFIAPPPHHPHAQYHPHMVLLPPPHAHPHGAPPYPPPTHPPPTAYHLAAMHHDPMNRPSWL